jgi:hypothetical protein
MHDPLPTPEQRHNASTIDVDVAPYARLDDETLDIIVGQFLTRRICNGTLGEFPDDEETARCSLAGDHEHHALDGDERPRPIVIGGDAFEQALNAFTDRIAPSALEIVQHISTTLVEHNDLYLTISDGRTLRRAYSSTAIAPADLVDVGQARRRAFVRAMLALLEAPTTIDRFVRVESDVVLGVDVR